MARRSIDGSRAIITGASSGIGRAIAAEMARRGASVVLTARRADRLEQLAGELRQQGAVAYCVAGDITEADVRQQVLAAAQEHLGGLDILVNNAGIGAIGPFAAATEQQLRRVMEVNFFAPAELMRLALPLLRLAERPIIVNIGSVLGHRAVPKKSEYCASKFALHGLSDSVRAELAGEAIDLLIVSPSTTRSEFFDQVIRKDGNLPWLAAGAMRSEVVARKTIRAMIAGRHEIILTPGGKLLVWLDRMMPPLMNRLLARFG